MLMLPCLNFVKFTAFFLWCSGERCMMEMKFVQLLIFVYSYKVIEKKEMIEHVSKEKNVTFIFSSLDR